MVQQCVVYFCGFTVIDGILPEQKVREERIHMSAELWLYRSLLARMVRKRDYWGYIFVRHGKGESSAKVSTGWPTT